MFSKQPTRRPRAFTSEINRTRAANVAANHIPFGKDRDDELEESLRGWLDDVVNDYLAERHAESDEGPAVRVPTLSEKARRAIVASVKRINAAPRKSGTRVFRRALRE